MIEANPRLLPPDHEIKYTICSETDGRYSFLHEESGFFIEDSVGTIYNIRAEAEKVLAKCADDSFILPIKFKVSIMGAGEVPARI